MTLNEQNRRQLEAYHAGTLPKTETVALKQRLADDADFRAAVERWETRWIIGTEPTSAERAETAALKQRLSALEATLPPVKSEAPPVLRRWWPAVAILAVALLSSLWYVLREEPEVKPVAPSVETPAAPPRIQAFDPAYFEHLPREGADLGSSVTEAYAAYDTKNYAAAWRLLAVSARERQDSLLLLYAGVAALGAGRADRAVEFLETARDVEKLVYFQTEIRWYLALAYLESGETAAGKALLEETIAAGGPWARRAAGLYRALGD